MRTNDVPRPEERLVIESLAVIRDMYNCEGLAVVRCLWHENGVYKSIKFDVPATGELPLDMLQWVPVGVLETMREALERAQKAEQPKGAS